MNFTFCATLQNMIVPFQNPSPCLSHEVQREPSTLRTSHVYKDKEEPNPSNFVILGHQHFMIHGNFPASPNENLL